MSLGNKPTLQDVYDEFTSGTRGLFSQQSLRNYYEHVISTSSSGGRLSDFANKGRPKDGKTLEATNVQATQATLNGSVDWNGVSTAMNTEIWFVWGLEDDALNEDTSRGDNNTSTSPSKTIMGLDPNTTYYYRVRFHNAFNSEDPTWGVNESGTGGLSASFTTASVCDPPTSVAVLQVSGQWQVSWDTSSTANSYNIYRRVNGSDTLMASEVSSSPYNINDPCSYGSTGDTFQMIVESNCSDNQTASAGSNELTLDCSGGEHQQ